MNNTSFAHNIPYLLPVSWLRNRPHLYMFTGLITFIGLGLVMMMHIAPAVADQTWRKQR